MKPHNDVIIEALKRSGGIITEASERLKVARKTLYEWMEKEPELKEYQQFEKENLIEIARKGLKDKLLEGSEKSLHFVLERLDKKSGFSNRVEITGKDGEALHPQINYTDLSEQTLRELTEKHRPSESESGT